MMPPEQNLMLIKDPEDMPRVSFRGAIGVAAPGVSRCGATGTVRGLRPASHGRLHAEPPGAN